MSQKRREYNWYYPKQYDIFVNIELLIKEIMKYFLKSQKYILIIPVCIGLYFLSRYNYLHFHILVEFYSIMIAFGIFAISWITRKTTEYDSLVFLGLSYLFVGIIDFYHTIAYKGMEVFTDYDFYANQLWVVARVLESISILLFSILKNRFNKKNYFWITPALILYTSIAFLSIFYWKIFPECFIPGKGQTVFKIYIEYIVCIILFISLVIIYKKRENYDPLLFKDISLSIILTILSEFSFTLYTDNYGITNVIGHLLKIISCYFIYHSVIVNTLKRPAEILYSDLNEAHNKISQQKKELEKAVNELKISNSTKDRFFSIIAHDLKSPFNPILGFSELLEIRYKDQGQSDENLEYIKAIKKSAENGFKLLNNLLTWARVQTGDMKFKPSKLDINNIIEDVIFLNSTQAKLKNIDIIFEKNISETLYLDEYMIKTVIRNLLSNAIKFTKIGGKIKFKLFKESGKVVISIHDNGVGIPKKYIKKIFDVSSKHSTIGTKGESGTGLGLILCKEFTEINKGDIEIESEPNKGTEIKLLFPSLD